VIIQKIDNYFLIKIFKDDIGDFNFFDLDSLQELFEKVFYKLKDKYELTGLIDVDVYVNFDYGMIIEMHPVYDYFEEIDMRLHIHLDNVFLVEIDISEILDYEKIYYYKDKFYGNYLGICDNEVFYKNTDEIIKNGVKIC